MPSQPSLTHEAKQDIFFGQIALIWARWFFIAAGAVLALWSARTVTEITNTVLIVVVLMTMNFFIHGRYLLEKPANRTVLMGLSLLDLLLATLVVAHWQTVGGLASPYFIFYYPLLFAFALVFTPTVSIGYTGLALIAYLVVCFIADPTLMVNGTMKDFVMLLTRLITLAAMGGLGTFYWRIQRAQRRALQV